MKNCTVFEVVFIDFLVNCVIITVLLYITKSKVWIMSDFVDIHSKRKRKDDKKK